MKITADVRDYAEGLSDNEKKALQLEAEKGMQDKSREFLEKGGEIYVGQK